MADAELTALRTRLGSRYHVERLLGRRGMGAAYLARELQLDRQVALKVLPASVADDGVLRDRFLRETKPDNIMIERATGHAHVAANRCSRWCDARGQSLEQRVEALERWHDGVGG